MEIMRNVKPTNDDIAEAICIRTSECFGALRMANALAGYETNTWHLIRHYSLENLKEEATQRHLSFTGEYSPLKGEIWQEPK